ncbi:MAG: hypothetical protein ABFC24_08895 [Methanoregulaceae archaeon]
MYGTFPDIWDEMDSLVYRMMRQHFGEPGTDSLDLPEHGGMESGSDSPASFEKSLVEPVAEVHRNPDSLSVVTELPGADPEAITLDLNSDTLVIEAESDSARFRTTADITGAPKGPVTSSFRNGVLEVTFREAASA